MPDWAQRLAVESAECQKPRGRSCQPGTSPESPLLPMLRQLHPLSAAGGNRNHTLPIVQPGPGHPGNPGPALQFRPETHPGCFAGEASAPCSRGTSWPRKKRWFCLVNPADNERPIHRYFQSRMQEVASPFAVQLPGWTSEKRAAGKPGSKPGAVFFQYSYGQRPWPATKSCKNFAARVLP